jgi:hypothetical protein
MGRLEFERPTTKALVTLAIRDAYRAMGGVTHPFMAAYAERCGAEFVVLEQRQVAKRYALDEWHEKSQLFDLAKHYDHIAFVDADILIAPNAPWVFELSHPHLFAAASEIGFSESERDKQDTQEVLGAVHWTNPCFNSGMMAFGKAHKAVFYPTRPDPTRAELCLWSTGRFREKHINLLNDQPRLNHRLNAPGIPLLGLGYRYNHTRVMPETSTRFCGFLIHYAAPSGHRYGSRLEQTQKDAAVLKPPWNFLLSRAIRHYRWVADRADFAFMSYLWSKLRRRRVRIKISSVAWG